MSERRQPRATLSVLERTLNRRGGFALLAELSPLNPRAGEILKLNGWHVFELEGRQVVGKARSARHNPFYETAWLTDEEAEVLAVVGRTDKATWKDLEAAFLQAERAFPDKSIANLVRLGYLSTEKAAWFRLGEKGKAAIAARPGRNLQVFDLRPPAQEKRSSEIFHRIEAMQTACMGSFRPDEAADEDEQAKLDTAVIVEAVTRGRIIPGIKVLKRLGTDEAGLDSSVRRLKACGALRNGEYNSLVPAALPDLMAETSADEGTAWTIALRLGRFRAEDAQAVWLHAASRQEVAVYPLLAEMIARGHLEPEGDGQYSVTASGRGFVGHFIKMAAELREGHMLRNAVAEADFAVSVWRKRTYQDGTGPAFMTWLPPAYGNETHQTLPPLPGDVRTFAITKRSYGPRTDEDGLRARAFDALAIGPTDARSLADGLGVDEANACRVLCWLAAKGLVKDVSPGARERSAAWAVLLETVGIAVECGKTSIPVVDQDEFDLATVFLADKGDPRVPRGCAPAYPATTRDRLVPQPPLQEEPQRGTTVANVLARLRQGPATVAELTDGSDVTAVRIRGIVDKLKEKGFVETVSTGPLTFAAPGHTPWPGPDPMDEAPSAALSP